ncbi:MAG: N-acetylmuramoyl-L-alanine amidase [Bacteroidetes bacterium HGW-Bacteroidetes-1]|jgi:N-acetylmuramoyl-L-alanine amidase|nr:MAG: N-acetylmuramoyl-L-alanine amidase [Bacteroidetes bacterium HGW-Bacteroidetes-1]
MFFKVQIYFQKMITRTTPLERIVSVIVVLLLIISPIHLHAQKGSKIRTVVIDAGHGGRDPGAVGKKSKEKDITLDVALKVGSYIKQNLPDVKIVYTRSRDQFIELHRRAAIANENDADVFISIHCNAAKDIRVYGAETFVMGEHRTNANLEVAKLENAAILLEENASDEYGGFDPNSTAAYIALSLYQSQNKHQSLILAQQVQEQFSKRVGRKDRSVQQAGFLVLYRTAMPSILVELGFITNPAEEAFLISEEGKVYMASAIYRAFKEYKTKFERDNTKPLNLPAEWEEVLVQKPKEATENIQSEKETIKTRPPTPSSTQEKSSNEAVKKTELIYKVQFATFTREFPLSDKRFSALSNIEIYFHDGLFKYTSGNFKTFAEAVAYQNRMRNKGYEDAFVVAFYNGKRIRIDEAEKIKK